MIISSSNVLKILDNLYTNSKYLFLKIACDVTKGCVYNDRSCSDTSKLFGIFAAQCSLNDENGQNHYYKFKRYPWNVYIFMIQWALVIDHGSSWKMGNNEVLS